MTNINWKVRIKNKTFWTTMVPALILLIQSIAKIFGFELDLGDLGNRILQVVDAVFVVLTLVGVVTDPTTEGTGDSNRAMTYTEPYKDEEKADE